MLPSVEEVKRAMGKRIRALRKAKGYTQEQLSELANISPNFLSDVERGKTSLSYPNLITIINLLGCTADDIFADLIQSGYKIRASRLSDQLEQLSPADRKKAFAIIEALIRQS